MLFGDGERDIGAVDDPIIWAHSSHQGLSRAGDKKPASWKRNAYSNYPSSFITYKQKSMTPE